MSGTDAPAPDADGWRRSAEIIERHRQRRRAIRVIVVTSVAVITWIAWVAYGAGGLAFGVLLALFLVTATRLSGLAGRHDVDAEVRFEDDELVLDGIIPDRVPLAELSGVRLVSRRRTPMSLTGSEREPSARRARGTRELLLVELVRNDDPEPHLLVNGELPLEDDELHALRSLLATRLTLLD